jgi:flagellar hook-associated protein 3 FlgL
MGQRVSSLQQTIQSNYYMQNNLFRLTELQRKISSNRNIENPSEDPVAYNRLMNIQSAKVIEERYTTNLNAAKAELSTADGAIKSLTDLVNRAKELAIQGASDTNSATNRNAIAVEINSMIDEVVRIGNTQYAGKYIFGGMNVTGIVPPAVTSTPIFNRTATNQVDYSGTGTTANPSFERKVEIAPGITLPMNVNGFTVFGSVQPNGAPPPATTGTGIVRTLTELMNNLQANNTTDIQTRITELDSDLTNILNEQAKIGGIQSQMELTENRMIAQQAARDEQFNAIQSVDLAKTISELNFQQTAYEASLGVTGRLFQTSLLNYL